MFKIISLLLIITTLYSNTSSSATTGQKMDFNGRIYVVADDSKDNSYLQLDANRSYSRENEVVTDNNTNLQWQDNESITKPIVTAKNYNARDYNNTTGDTASTYCANLSLDGGGWRLPSIKELQTVVDNGKINPALLNGVFLNHSDSYSYYWSSTNSSEDPSHAIFMLFGSGFTQYYYKSFSYYVRCVRNR